jgi:hypothetical protein
MRNFIGNKNAIWFIGVVEDRNDPVQLGRVRVRCYGYHTDDKDQIPTNQLPWAIVINSINSASVSGIGHSPTGMVEGSWVFGIFLDGQRAQEPAVLGTIPGAPVEEAETSLGFNDPNGEFPRYTKDSDVNYAARESKYDQHAAFIDKTTGRLDPDGEVQEYYTATPPNVSTVSIPKSSSYYEDVTWAEPQPQNGKSPLYPKNHVYETESGHLVEFDDTENNRRYHRYHPAGSFEEIIDDGSRIFKVVGKDYEMILNGKNIFINGDVNMTVTGDKRELIQGNYHLEVEGETTFNLKNSLQTKIGGNDEKEILGSKATNIKANYNTTVAADVTNTIGGNRTTTIGRQELIVTTGGYNVYSIDKVSVFGVAGMRVGSLANFTTTVGGVYSRSATSALIETVSSVTEIAATGTITYTTGQITVNGVALSTHTHTDTPGLGAGITSPPIPTGV